MLYRNGVKLYDCENQRTIVDSECPSDRRDELGRFPLTGGRRPSDTLGHPLRATYPATEATGAAGSWARGWRSAPTCLCFTAGPGSPRPDDVVRRYDISAEPHDALDRCMPNRI